MEPANTAIELSGITKRFGSVVANDHIDLSVKQGEILALLGGQADIIIGDNRAKGLCNVFEFNRKDLFNRIQMRYHPSS